MGLLRKYEKDIKLAIVVMFIAGCGFVYQYLISSYSSRVIGSMETVIYTIITIMVISMGFGSFLAKYFKNKFVVFSILESIIGLLAVVTIYFISGAEALSNNLPAIISEAYQLPPEYLPKGGFINTIYSILGATPYIMSFILGTLIGLEIPLIASIREELYKGTDLKNNIGIIYGIDYIGAGIAAFIWILFLMKLEVHVSLAILANTNVVIGFVFILFFRKNITKIKTVMGVQILTSILIVYLCAELPDWNKKLTQSLYKNEVIYTKNTQYQQLAITREINPYSNERILSFFINGKTQFSEGDEGVYHSLLVYPALMAANMPKNVLVIGGGDGLALRDILKTKVESVTLLDLDESLVNLFKNPVYSDGGEQINKDLILLNNRAFWDERVKVIYGDAYLNIKKLIKENKKFGAIIIDLPDPSHPDLNKLYTTDFYKKINYLLTDSGAVAIQSTSPYLAKNVFISIGKTLHKANFIVDQYQHIIPSFGGQWGWTIGTKIHPSARARIERFEELPFEDEFLTKGKILSTFEFGKNYYKNVDNIKVNDLGSNSMYNYYLESWRTETTSVFE
jgi:spermidine synthase